MSTICRIVFLMMIMLAYETVTGTQNITIEVGGKVIYVPAPAGFHEISKLSPETRKLAETFTSPNNRLLAVFVSENDLGRIMKGKTPDLMQYMLLQVERQLEHSDVSVAQFLQLVDQVKQQQNNLLEIKNKINSMLDDKAGILSKEHCLSLKLKFGEIVPLGIFMEKRDAVAFATLSKYRTLAEGQQLDYLLAGGASFMRVKGKILYAYIYCNYENINDLKWVRATTSSWVDQILTVNLSQNVANQTASRRGIIGLILGGLLIATVAAIQWLKRLFNKR